MQSNTFSIGKILLVILGLAIIGLIIFRAGGADEPSPVTSTSDTSLATAEETTTEADMMDETDGSMAEMDGASDDMTNDDMMKDETMVTETASAEPAAAGIYTEYDESLLANAEDGDVLLFFSASWCPSCRALDKNISENLDAIPSDVTILKLDYDSETELKQKYGVVRQHTLVQVDANGNEIQTLAGLTNTLEQTLSKI